MSHGVTFIFEVKLIFRFSGKIMKNYNHQKYQLYKIYVIGNYLWSCSVKGIVV